MFNAEEYQSRLYALELHPKEMAVRKGCSQSPSLYAEEFSISM
jgi:hypothetical protein